MKQEKKRGFRVYVRGHFDTELKERQFIVTVYAFGQKIVKQFGNYSDAKAFKHASLSAANKDEREAKKIVTEKAKGETILAKK